MHQNERPAPPGFERNTRFSPVTDAWEPLYTRTTDKAVIIGLWLAKPHTNARGLIHGGLIAALADKAMGHSGVHVMNQQYSLVTISLSIDYIGSAKIGQWLTVETDVIKTGKTICFTQCAVLADGEICARGSATFRAVARKA